MIEKTKSNQPSIAVIDGNEAAAKSAYSLNEICIIYPITPASQMGEWTDQWATEGRTNIFDTVPHVVTMQSEAGASGAMHGALQTGALATTFTSSQGLLLMIPIMYRIAGELTPTVFHVACRSIATEGMSIYCEHSDVMATRATGFAILFSSNVQEAHDMAAIAQLASLQSNVPFLHAFDGFRTSHEVTKITAISDDQLKQLINEDFIANHRANRLTADNPSVRGLIYNADIFFQQREAVNKYYAALPEILDGIMQQFAKVTGRNYGTLEYVGAPDAEQVIILMGSGTETSHETVEYLNQMGEKVGIIKVHLFRPFPKQKLFEILPKTCRAIAVLDRTKEPGSIGEPLYEEISTAFMDAYNSGDYANTSMPKIIGGRYGISSKEFTPAMIKAIFDELKQPKTKNHFTIGIEDDVTKASLIYDNNFKIEHPSTLKAIFYGLGADGTVSANKNTVKIIGEETDFNVQAYFLYDAKKSGSKTVSHLRFSKDKIRSEYLIDSANFIGCHQFNFITTTNVLENAANGATFLLNSSYDKDTVWNHLPRELQTTIIEKKINFWVIDAMQVAEKTGMGGRINTIMQTCFFALCNILPKDVAIKKIKAAIQKTYSDKGEKVVAQNFAAVDYTLENLHQVTIPAQASSKLNILDVISTQVSDFVRRFTAKLIDNKGDTLPVSAMSATGYYPSHTTRYEKRNITTIAPIWDPETCIQCGQCSLVCPHAVLRAKQYDKNSLKKAPKTFKSAKLRGKDAENKHFTLQAYIEDCTACELCVKICPVKNPNNKKAINLETKSEDLSVERENIKFFESLPTIDPAKLDHKNIRDIQYLPPMFEFCGACAGCGEAPYVRLLTQLFGDRLLIGNACGCSSVYGGQLPTSPWTVNDEGRGPAWSSSLFEDNAEFAYGCLLSENKHREMALELLEKLATKIDKNLVQELIANVQNNTSEGIQQQRVRIAALKQKLTTIPSAEAKELHSLANQLTRHSIWGVGGDGWAYDIGFGGLDHVLASGRNIKLLVLDTEVYSNTGGQASKATPRGAVVKFASQGKPTAKKDLGLMMMTYGNIYVASIALGANPAQTIRAFNEAENYNGPSLIIAYSHCIAHGIDMTKGLEQQKLAVKSGYWPLYRYNPDRIKEGLNPFQLDSQKPGIPYQDYALNENRFKILLHENPELAATLLQQGQDDINNRWKQYEALLGEYR